MCHMMIKAGIDPDDDEPVVNLSIPEDDGTSVYVMTPAQARGIAESLNTAAAAADRLERRAEAATNSFIEALRKSPPHH